MEGKKTGVETTELERPLHEDSDRIIETSNQQRLSRGLQTLSWPASQATNSTLLSSSKFLHDSHS